MGVQKGIPMPPKAKFSKSELIQAALDLVRTEGSDALTARALGLRLGSSARPIFTIFQNMDEVRQEVVEAARKLYDNYVREGLTQGKMPAFKGVGMQYIRFSLTEPKLFQLLFMSAKAPKPALASILPAIDDNYPQILSSIQSCYPLDQEKAQWLYRHLWIYTHGIAVLCATNMCLFSLEEIGKMLTEVCTAMLREIQAPDT